tara:strand:- start:269 stop:673 length:405 start_codon:yes stop_codon:yes gene_type:complete
MGFFSWKLSDTNESLRNRHTEQGATPCKMLLPNGDVIEELQYDGYGTFGKDELDFYQLVHELTEGLFFGDGDRQAGINIWFANEYGGKYQDFVLDKPMIAPKLVSIDYKGDYDSVPDSKDCEHQGYFYDFWEEK